MASLLPFIPALMVRNLILGKSFSSFELDSLVSKSVAAMDLTTFYSLVGRQLLLCVCFDVCQHIVNNQKQSQVVIGVREIVSVASEGWGLVA